MTLIFYALNEHPNKQFLFEVLDVAVSLLQQRGWGFPALEAVDRARTTLEAISYPTDLAKEAADWYSFKERKLYLCKRALEGINAYPLSGEEIARLTAEKSSLEAGLRRGRPAQEGDVLAGRFELVRRIGEGRFAEVWSGLDRKRQRAHVAVKLLRGELRNDDVQRERFRSGATIMQEAAETIRGIVKVHEPLGEDGPYFYIAMELASSDGHNLERLAIKRTSESVPEEDADSAPTVWNLLLEACGTVHSLHTKINCLHLDLKPSNILIDGNKMPLISGFEWCLSVSHGAVTYQARPHPARNFAAPEIEAGDRADHRADQFSLGRIGLFLLAPKDFERVIRMDNVGAGLPPGPVSVVLRRASHNDPKRRYDSVAAFATELRAALRSQTSILPWLELLKSEVPTHVDRTTSRQVEVVLSKLPDVGHRKLLVQYMEFDGVIDDEASQVASEALEISRRLLEKGRILEFWRWFERLDRDSVLREMRERSDDYDRSRGRPRLSLMPINGGLGTKVDLDFGVAAPWPAAQVGLGSDGPDVAHEEARRMLELLAQGIPVATEPANDLRQNTSLASRELFALWYGLPERGVVEWVRGRYLRLLPLLSLSWQDSRVRAALALLLWARHEDVPTGGCVRNGMGLGPLLYEMVATIELELLSVRIALRSGLSEGAGHALDSRRAQQLEDSLRAARRVNPTLFRLLLDWRPHWQDEILAVAEREGLDRAACISDLPPPVEPIWALTELLLAVWPDGILPGPLEQAMQHYLPSNKAAPLPRLLEAAKWFSYHGYTPSDFPDALATLDQPLRDHLLAWPEPLNGVDWRFWPYRWPSPDPAHLTPPQTPAPEPDSPHT